MNFIGARHRWRRNSLLLRLSRTYADIILLAQLLGALANLIWYLNISTADIIGFIDVGGDIAGLSSYFGFMLFAILFFIVSPRRFWYSLHPLNLGIALILLSAHRLWNANELLIALAAISGAVAGYFGFRYARLYPRAALLFCAVIVPLIRFMVTRELLPYLVAGAGVLLITIICAPLLLRLFSPPKKLTA